MPKQKTHRGTAKRIKITKGGLKRRAAYRNHILEKKSKKRKRNLRRCVAYVNKADVNAIYRLLNIV